MDKARQYAFLSLVKSDTSQSFSNIEINTVIERQRLTENEASLFTALYMGVLERKITLDYIISKYSKIPLEKIDVETVNALRLGLYQLVYMDRIPDYSAIDESVKLAKKSAKGFVNAILRSFLRNSKKIPLPSEKWQGVSVESSMPLDIINVWRKSYGDAVALELATHQPDKRKLSVRVNTLKTSVDAICAELQKRGIETEISHFSDDVVRCACPISRIKDLIDGGEIFIQDEASRIAVKILGAKKGEKIADVCACPGGKTFSCAIDMENEGEIYASDLHANKLSLIDKGAEKLGISIVKTRELDAKSHVCEYEKAFDRVLCDVPCSGLGVVFKKPDIKYKQRDGLCALQATQYAILSNCANYVKVGGVLIFSTCTLNRDENESNVERFLAEHEDFMPYDFEISEIKSINGAYTFFPNVTGTDGFFVSRMKRVK